MTWDQRVALLSPIERLPLAIVTGKPLTSWCSPLFQHVLLETLHERWPVHHFVMVLQLGFINQLAI